MNDSRRVQKEAGGEYPVEESLEKFREDYFVEAGFSRQGDARVRWLIEDFAVARGAPLASFLRFNTQSLLSSSLICRQIKFAFDDDGERGLLPQEIV